MQLEWRGDLPLSSGVRAAHGGAPKAANGTSVLAPACDGGFLANGLPQSDGAASPVWLRPLNADVAPSRSQFGTFVGPIGMCDREWPAGKC